MSELAFAIGSFVRVRADARHIRAGQCGEVYAVSRNMGNPYFYCHGEDGTDFSAHHSKLETVTPDAQHTGQHLYDIREELNCLLEMIDTAQAFGYQDRVTEYLAQFGSIESQLTELVQPQA